MKVIELFEEIRKQGYEGSRGKDDTGIKVVKTRPPIYSKEALFVVERIWEMADYPLSERLVIQIPLWLPRAKLHMKWITPEIEKEVWNISARQIDRRLKQKKNKLKRRMYGRTKPGTLKHHIPIKTASLGALKRL